MKLESFGGAISYQTIYSFVRENQWCDLLPRKGKRYKRRKGVEAGAGGRLSSFAALPYSGRIG
jgi:IS30 family transposase